ncbi:MAG: nucleotidyltransferase family protein [Alphaproteobacteria bacterium GM202ARS2]|nr:nucleotidyltransferase family protein [Alphaproteobacteria bacterium GM202ARS2]
MGAPARDTEDLSNEDVFLLAVATGRMEKLPSQVQDVELLVKLIAEHNLQGRCLRHRQDLQERFPGPLLAEIATTHQQTEANYRRNVGALGAVIDHFGHEVGTIIKGFSIFLLTRDPALLRCGDIDLVLADARALIEHLLDTGYVQTRQPFMHEIGEFTRDGVEFDLQWGFPISRYPDSIWGAPKRPVWGAGLMQATLIEAAELNADNTHLSTETPPICIPSAEFAVLIAAAHSFMNFTNLWSISHREKTWLRLAELADVQEMTVLDGFSRARFAQLVERYQAWDIVAWIDWIWTMLSGRPIFNLSSQRPFPSAAPCCLWWNLWIDLLPPISLMLGDRWYPHAAVTERVIADAACLGNTTENSGTAWRDLSFTWVTPGREGLYQLQGSLIEGWIGLRISGIEPLPGITVRVRLDCSMAEEEVVVACQDLNHRVERAGSSLTVDVGQGMVRATASLDNLSSRGAIRAADRDGFLGILVEEGSTVTASALIPLATP